MNTRLNWGILSTGKIAGTFARNLTQSKTSRLVAVGSRSIESAQKFAAEHGVGRAHGSYEALLADPEVQALYIATPHPQHLEWTLKAAQAGKHILCEKPLGINHAEGVQMVEAARRNKILLMEAFMYRCHPQTAKIVELVRSGVLGEVKLVQASFGFFKEFHPTERLWARELGGGGILDVGCYPVSFSRLVAGAAAGKPFLDPIEVTGAGWLHPETKVDGYAAATLRFANGVVSQVSAAIAVHQEIAARIHGTQAWLDIPMPWFPAMTGGKASLWLHRRGQSKPEKIVINTDAPLYAIEADTFAAALASGLREVPQISLDDTLGNLATLDRWRATVGVKYASE